jgi:uncharacterized protein (DUF885 family)
LLADVETKLDAVFEVKPSAGYEVQRVPPFREAGAPLAYYVPASLDRKRKGIFFANLG